MRFKGILFLLFFLFCITAFGQTTKHNPWIFKFDQNIEEPFSQSEKDKIQSAFGLKKLQSILSNKAISKYYKNILRNRISIHNKQYHPNEKLNPLSEISTKSSQNFNGVDSFNPFLYNFPFSSTNPHYYRIDGTDLIVILKPQNLK